MVTCFGAKVCWYSCASTTVYSLLGGTTSDLGHGPEITPHGALACVGLILIADLRSLATAIGISTDLQYDRFWLQMLCHSQAKYITKADLILIQQIISLV